MQHSDRMLRFDKNVPPLFLECSSLVPVKHDLLLASTYNGCCILFDVRTGDVELQPQVNLGLAGVALDVPSVALTDPTLFAVSGHIVLASVWRRGEKLVRRLQPNHSSAVNSVALSPDGAAIALGTGYLPLNPETRKAAVEIWSLDEQPRCLASTLLPDVVVMGLAWHPSSPHLLATTATSDHSGGHLWLLDVPSLSVAGSAEVRGGIPKRAGFLDRGSSVIFFGKHHVEQRLTGSIDRIARHWSFEPGIEHAAISTTSDEVLLSTGHLLRPKDNSMRRLDLPPKCVATAILPSGKYVAMTAEGQLRVWDRPALAT